MRMVSARFFALKSAKLYTGVLVGAGVVLGIALFALSGSPLWGAFGFIVIVVGLPTYFAVLLVIALGPLAVHELGHLVAGWLVGFELSTMLVGPIGIRRTSKGIVRYTEGPLWRLSGYVTMLPKRTDRLVPKVRLFILGGTLASILFIALILWLDFRVSKTLNIFELPQKGPIATLLFLFTVYGIVLLFGTIIPFRSRGAYSDSAMVLLSLWRPRFARFLALNMLVASDFQQGKRARDWNEAAVLEMPTLWNSPATVVSSASFAYYHFLDRGDVERATQFLLPAYESVRAKAFFVQSASKQVCYEMAFTSALTGNTKLANEAFKHAESISGRSAVRSRGMAAICQSAGHYAEAVARAAEAEEQIMKEEDVSLPRIQAELDFVKLALTAKPSKDQHAGQPPAGPYTFT